MTSKSKVEIKAFFETGDRPTQSQFIDLIDSYVDRSGPIGTLETLLSAQQTGPMIASNGTPSITSYTSFFSSLPLATTAQAVAGNATGVGMDPTLTRNAIETTHTYTGAQIGSVTALTSTSNSIAIDLSANNNFSHTFTENTTLANPSNVVAGQSGRIVFTQHASSPKTLAFGSYWLFAATENSGSDPAVTATNSAIDVLYYDVISSTQIVAHLGKGYA